MLILLAVLLLSAAMCGLGGCSRPGTPVIPPPALSWNVQFKWDRVTPTATDCTLAASYPCEQLELSDQDTGKVVATPALASTSYLLFPGPKAWPHHYSLALVLYGSPDRTHSTRSIVPATVTLEAPTQ